MLRFFFAPLSYCSFCTSTHHRVECLGFRLHVVTRTRLYGPYFRTVYAKAKGTDDLLEEALANAAMYLRLDEKAYQNLCRNPFATDA